MAATVTLLQRAGSSTSPVDTWPAPGARSLLAQECGLLHVQRGHSAGRALLLLAFQYHCSAIAYCSARCPTGLASQLHQRRPARVPLEHRSGSAQLKRLRPCRVRLRGCSLVQGHPWLKATIGSCFVRATLWSAAHRGKRHPGTRPPTPTGRASHVQRTTLLSQ